MNIPEQLPQLERRWLTAYRGLWLLFLLLALLGTALMLERDIFGKRVNDLNYTFGLRAVNTGEQFTWTPISDLPGTADVVSGSTLVAIDGEPFVGGADNRAFEQLDRLLSSTGDTVRLDFLGPDGRAYSTEIERSPDYLIQSDDRAGVSFDLRFWVRTAIGQLINFMAIGVAVLLYRRRVRDPVPAYMSLGLLAYVARFAFFFHSDEAPLLVWGLAFVGLVFNLSLSLAFLAFPEGRLRPRLIQAALVLAFVYSTVLFAKALGWEASWTDTPMTITFVVLLVTLIVATIFKVRRSEEHVQQQLKWAVLGFGGFAFFMLSGVLLGRLDVTTMGATIQVLVLFAQSLTVFGAMLCLLAGLLVSLLRYRLYDAEAAIGNSIWVGALTISLLLIFAGSEKLFELAGERIFGEDMGIASGAIAAGLAAILAGPLYTRLHGWAERTFQRDMVRLRDGLPALVGDLRETEAPGSLAATALERIDHGVRASVYALLMHDGDDQVVLAAREAEHDDVVAWLEEHSLPTSVIETDRTDPVFPERIPLSADGIDFAATLLVGRRSDGTLIGKDERRALTEVAEPLARALAISLRRTRRIEEEIAERTALKERIARLEQWIEKQGPKPEPA